MKLSSSPENFRPCIIIAMVGTSEKRFLQRTSGKKKKCLYIHMFLKGRIMCYQERKCCTIIFTLLSFCMHSGFVRISN